jgi:hypothetical protein
VIEPGVFPLRSPHHASHFITLLSLKHSDVEPTIRCNATIALAKCANHLPENVRDKVVASSMHKVGPNQKN